MLSQKTLQRDQMHWFWEKRITYCSVFGIFLFGLGPYFKQVSPQGWNTYSDQDFPVYTSGKAEFSGCTGLSQGKGYLQEP